MHLKSLCVLVGVAVLAAGGLARDASAQPPEIYPLSKVRRGQKGYGLTTNAGVKPFRFEFEVIGVNKNFLPKLDIILVKSDDPKMQLTGFWRGMSGSPLFIEGKLACAFSYGYRFNKVPIGGCTPLHYMMKDASTARRMSGAAWTRGSRRPASNKTSQRTTKKQRWIGPKRAASWKDWLAVAPDRTAQSALYHMSPPREPWLMKAPLPRRLRSPAADDKNGMVAATVPLAVSGFSADAFSDLKDIMKGFPIEPMRAGGTGQSDTGPRSFVLGAPIGVQLLRGDMAGTGTCTVSYVSGDQVLACGHPMFNAGEIYAPVSASMVHTVIPSSFSAFVVASPLRELGALVQDRQSMIAASTSLRTRMVPIDITVRGPGKDNTHQFHVEVINNRFFTATFAGIAASNAIQKYLPDRDRVTVLIRSTVHITGHKPLQFVDYLSASSGARRVIGGSRGLRVLVPLLSNPFNPVEIERVQVDARIAFDTNFGQITHLRLPTARLKPGKRNYVEVRMTTFDGKDIVERVPFDVPKELAGSIVRLKVVAGDGAGVEAPPPKSVKDLIDTFRKLLPGNVYAVVLYAAAEGASINGQIVKDLPSSALDKLRPATRTPRTTTYRMVSRSTYPSKRVLNGSKSILVHIADE